MTSQGKKRFLPLDFAMPYHPPFYLIADLMSK
jgi:hypothetical protein